MFNRDDLIGILFLAFCAAIGGVLVYGIATGTRFRLDGPSWLGTALALLFFGAIIYAFVTRPGRRWPDPQTGLGGWWRRLWPWSRRKEDR